MSTHYRPRPPTAPTTPQRPSTAHSTIRAVPPSPPDSIKNLHYAAAPDFNAVKRSGPYGNYMPDPLQVSPHIKRTSSSAPAQGAQLRRGGARSGRTSPTKPRPLNPQKPDHVVASVMGESQTGQLGRETPEPEGPDTPSPVTREQKRRMYEPLGFSQPLTPPSSSGLDTQSPQSPGSGNLSTPTAPSPPSQHHSPSITEAVTSESRTRQSPPSPPMQMTRTSSSSTSRNAGNSIRSRHSVFSTPGRDELERKKALVEADEGPFGRVKSLGELQGERRRVSGGSKEDGERWRVKEEKEKVGCGGCCVM